jgi:hypothetical protein
MYISPLTAELPPAAPSPRLCKASLDRIGGTSTCWIPFRACSEALILAAAAAKQRSVRLNLTALPRDSTIGVQAASKTECRSQLAEVSALVWETAKTGTYRRPLLDPRATLYYYLSRGNRPAEGGCAREPTVASSLAGTAIVDRIATHVSAQAQSGRSVNA